MSDMGINENILYLNKEKQIQENIEKKLILFEYINNISTGIVLEDRIETLLVFDEFGRNRVINRKDVLDIDVQISKELKNHMYKYQRQYKHVVNAVSNDSSVKDLYDLDDDLELNLLVQRGDKLKLINSNVYHLRHTKLENTVYSYATLTSVNPNTLEYNAVAHPITVGSNTKYKVKYGFIFLADTVYNAKKSKSLSPGSIDADVVLDKPIGTITEISSVGIKGMLVDVDSVDECGIYPIAKYNEIKLGDAYILSQDNKTNKIIKSKIEITKIDNPTNTIIPGTVHFKVVDKNLIKERGGTVRGMSGSPIIQNGKIIGALSHGNILFSKVGKMTYIGYMIENGG